MNDRERYSYFYRAIPPDDQQVQAMVDLLVHIRWIYVSVIYSNTASDESGIEAFRWLAQNVGISIDMDLGIDDDITSNELFGLTR